MQNPDPFEVLAAELGDLAGRIDREASLRIDAALSDMRRLDAERELRFSNLERLVTDRMATIKDGRDGAAGAPGRDGADGKDGRDGIDGVDGKDGAPGADGAPGKDGEPSQAAIDGAPGKDGRDGVDGKDGAPGRDGIDGRDGDPGAAGRDGIDGKDGIPGRDGADGKDGVPGAAGRDGEPGIAGKDGRDGTNGFDGKDGRDGKDGERGAAGAPGKLPIVKSWIDGVFYEGDVVARDGATYQAIRDTGRAPPHDDWIPVASAGRDGRSFSVKGTYSKGAEYAAMDVIALNGASFVALRDAPGECPGPDWQLLCMQGKAGRPGDRGLQGPEGKRGAPGPAVVATDIDAEGQLTLTNGDGSTVKCDFYPLLSRIHSA